MLSALLFGGWVDSADKRPPTFGHTTVKGIVEQGTWRALRHTTGGHNELHIAPRVTRALETCFSVGGKTGVAILLQFRAL